MGSGFRMRSPWTSSPKQQQQQQRLSSRALVTLVTDRRTSNSSRGHCSSNIRCIFAPKLSKLTRGRSRPVLSVKPRTARRSSPHPSTSQSQHGVLHRWDGWPFLAIDNHTRGLPFKVWVGPSSAPSPLTTTGGMSVTSLRIWHDCCKSERNNNNPSADLGPGLVSWVRQSPVIPFHYLYLLLRAPCCPCP